MGAVTDVAGKIDFKVDKNGIIHASIGKASFDAKKIEDNANELLKTVQKMRLTLSKVRISRVFLCPVL